MLWTTSEFGFARLSEESATGSSIMPQKLNPDVAELARGKAGTAIGRLTGLLATVKSLPLAYDRDLQEDKPPVFAARRDVAGALAALRVLVGGLAFDHGRLAAATADPLLLATDAAEALVARRRAVSRRARAGCGGGAGGDASRRLDRSPTRTCSGVASTWPPRSPTLGCAGRDRAAASLARRPRPVADRRPRSGRGGGDPRHGGQPERRPHAARPWLDARALLLEALDEDARVVLGRDRAPRRQLDPALAGRAAAFTRRVAARHGSRALALRRRARRADARACRAGGVGRVGERAGAERAHCRRASVPGARRRADDPRPARLARRRPRRAGSATARTCSSRWPRSVRCSGSRSWPRARPGTNLVPTRL